MKYKISVALPVPIDKNFDYFVEYDGDIPEVGCRVLVPFGERQKLFGVILNAAPAAIDDDNLKNAIQIIDEEPYFSSEMINFLTWLAEYYLTPLGEVFRVASPSIMPVEIKRKVKLLAEPTEEELDAISRRSPKVAKIMQLLMEATGDLSVSTISRKIGSACSQQLNKMAERNFIEIFEEKPKKISQKTAKFVRINPELLFLPVQLEEEISRIERKSPKRAVFLNMFRIENRRNEFLKCTFASEHFGCSIAVINGLIETGILEMQVMPDNINKEEIKLASKKEIDLPLTDEQNEVVKRLIDKFDSNNLQPNLLHGITGSGKTLIYMHLIKHVLTAGKTVILLVPEISLTPQLIDRFELSFPEMLAVIHSKMTKAEKEKSIVDIQNGSAKIVIGARSAVFAPCKNLGLIIVDEEHDSSFKQDSPAPRYNGRDAAIVRAKFENAEIVLGSATPSVESMYNAMHGKYELLKINSRADNATLPTIKTIDMLSANKSGQVFKTISKQLLDEIEKRLERREGVILYQNRRGFSSYLQCDDCGYVHGCPHCSVNLTYHKVNRQLKCHYCGYTEPAYNACTNCGSVKLSVKGSGTQMVEEELNEYFADYAREVKVERMDSDSTATRGEHRRILQRFATGATDILIGTQMVAKGLDFERVSLVGVVNADLQLMMPDFRANERAFQVLTQVSGRAGRKNSNGEVFIQTTKAELPVIQAVINSSYDMFFHAELESREEVFFPPFARLIIIEVSSENQDKTIRHANTLHKLLKLHQALMIYPPTAPLIEKIREQYRRIIVIKDNKKIDASGVIARKILRIALNEYINCYADREVKIKLDIDAYNNI